MTGQITAPGTLPLALVGGVVVVSMLLGAIDIARQPGWAWKQAEESQLAYLMLDLLLPVIGLGMYAFRARPKVIAAVAAGADTGRTAEAPSATDDPEDERAEPAAVPTTADAAPNRFSSFREVAGTEPGYGSPEIEPATEPVQVFEISGTFFSTGAATRTVRHPLALARAYRPKQRTSLTESESESESELESELESEAELGFQPRPETETETETEIKLMPEPELKPEPEPEPESEPEPQPTVDEIPTVPSGWKVDPTGRHQFRYWDGCHWTENVADDGAETRDAVSA